MADQVYLLPNPAIDARGKRVPGSDLLGVQMQDAVGVDHERDGEGGLLAGWRMQAGELPTAQKLALTRVDSVWGLAWPGCVARGTALPASSISQNAAKEMPPNILKRFIVKIILSI
jgi:hypothetical protein